MEFMLSADCRQLEQQKKALSKELNVIQRDGNKNKSKKMKSGLEFLTSFWCSICDKSFSRKNGCVLCILYFSICFHKMFYD